MHKRCSLPTSTRFHQYGGRGIRVCERWSGKDGLVNFLADMGPKPSPQHSLDRIDVNGNYEPGNCRWATPIAQSRNRRPTAANLPLGVGSGNPRAILTEALVAEARARHRDGETIAGLAERYGVSQRTMARALSGQTWSHVTDTPREGARL
jgi:hypothetical protein